VSNGCCSAGVTASRHHRASRPWRYRSRSFRDGSIAALRDLREAIRLKDRLTADLDRALATKPERRLSDDEIADAFIAGRGAAA
jgi:hypothetical protein